MCRKPLLFSSDGFLTESNKLVGKTLLASYPLILFIFQVLKDKTPINFRCNQISNYGFSFYELAISYSFLRHNHKLRLMPLPLVLVRIRIYTKSYVSFSTSLQFLVPLYRSFTFPQSFAIYNKLRF